MAEQTAFERVLKARRLMDRAPGEVLDLDRLAAEAGLSRYHFVRSFARVYGDTPHRYLVGRRMERARAMLRRGGRSVTEVCFAVGFRSVGSFSAAYRRYAGETPRQTRAAALERRREPERFIPACHLRMIRSAA